MSVSRRLDKENMVLLHRAPLQQEETISSLIVEDRRHEKTCQMHCRKKGKVPNRYTCYLSYEKGEMRIHICVCIDTYTESRKRHETLTVILGVIGWMWELGAGSSLYPFSASFTNRTFQILAARMATKLRTMFPRLPCR